MADRNTDEALGRFCWPDVIDETARSLSFGLAPLPGMDRVTLVVEARLGSEHHEGHALAAAALLTIHKLLTLPFGPGQGFFFARAAFRVASQRSMLYELMLSGGDPTLQARLYAAGLGELAKIIVAEGGYKRLAAWTELVD